MGNAETTKKDLLFSGLNDLILLARTTLKQHDIRKVDNIDEKKVVERYWRTFFQIILVNRFGPVAPGIKQDQEIYAKFEKSIKEIFTNNIALSESANYLEKNYGGIFLNIAAHFFNANDNRITSFIVNLDKKDTEKNDEDEQKKEKFDKLEKMWLKKWDVMAAINHLAKEEENQLSNNKKGELEKKLLPFSNSGNFITRYSEETDDSKNLIFIVGDDPHSSSRNNKDSPCKDELKAVLIDEEEGLFHVPSKFTTSLYKELECFIKQQEAKDEIEDYDALPKLPEYIINFCNKESFWNSDDVKCYIEILEHFFKNRFGVKNSGETMITSAITSHQLRIILTNHLYVTRTFRIDADEFFDKGTKSYYYYLPIWHKSISYLGLVATRKLESFEIKFFKNFTDRIFGLAYAHDSARKLKQDKDTVLKKSLITAMASIMARNMSHNIGSHVLSQASSESISVSDNRKLNSYIQHRMDYIALVSTEFPKWTAQAWFLSDVMKRFYMQYHLLNFIGKSEGLCAFRWGTTTKKGIRITISKNGTELINCKGEAVGGLQDFMVDIPGGIVGYQAFYTIFENIIRNSAKHDWSKKKEGNLEISIDIEEPERGDCYYLTIFQKNVQQNGDKIGENADDLENNKINIENFEEIICDSFLDGRGELNKKNWGLAEIRISAGFLNKKGYLDIGSKSKKRLINENANSGYIQPVMKDGKLGYKLKLKKPKYILIVGTDSYKKYEENLAENKDLYSFLVRNGVVFLKRITPEDLHEGLNFSFVYFDDSAGEDLDGIFSKVENFLEKLPCRITSQIDIGHSRRIQTIGDLELKKCFSSVQGKIEEFKLSVYDKYLEKKFHPSFSSCKLYVKVTGESFTPDENRTREFVNRDINWFFDTVLGQIAVTQTQLEIFKNQFEKQKNTFSMDTLFEALLMHKDNLIPDLGIVGDILDEARIEKFTFLKEALTVYGIYQEITNQFLFKYDEHIPTLPRALQANGDKGKEDSVLKETGFLENTIYERFSPLQKDVLKSQNNPMIIYNRHEKKEGIAKLWDKEGVKRPKYLESLSGSQLYYNALVENYRNNDYMGYIFRRELLENGLLRYLIIDERLATYIRLNKNISIMAAMGIEVPFMLTFCDGNEEPETLKIIEDEGGAVTNNSPSGKINLNDIKDGHYDIVIVHQGVLDKLEKRDLFFKKMHKKIPWVFITSGRGKSEQVIKGVKFFPFSIIESTLMKDYPEKFTLSMTLMKLIEEMGEGNV